MPDSDNRHIPTFLQHITFPDFKHLVRRREIGNRRPAATQIHRPLMTGNRQSSLHSLVVVTRMDHGHARNHPHHAHVLQSLVRCTVFPHGQTRMRSVNLHIGLGIRHRLADLVVNATRRKLGKSPREWNLPSHRHTRSNADHIGFGDADLKKTLGIRLGKSIHLDRTGQIRRQRHYLRHFLGCQHQTRTETGTGIFLFGKRIFVHLLLFKIRFKLSFRLGIEHVLVSVPESCLPSSIFANPTRHLFQNPHYPHALESLYRANRLITERKPSSIQKATSTVAPGFSTKAFSLVEEDLRLYRERFTTR